MNRKALPNLLTGFRLAAAPAVALLMLGGAGAAWAAVVLFTLAALTDFVDGWMARAWDAATPMGAMLDPVADKAMVVIALAAICARDGAGFWLLVPVVVILFREVFVSGLREYLGQAASGLQVTKLAKWKTTLQLVAIGLLLTPLAWVQAAGLLLLWGAAMVTGLTGWDYFQKARSALAEGVR